MVTGEAKVDKGAPVQYSALQKLLHWSIAALIAVQYLWLDRMGGAFHRIMDGREGAYTTVSVLHIVIGTLVLLLACLRLGLRLRRGVPEQPMTERGWATLLAITVHWVFYVLLFALPILGLLAWFLGIGEAAGLHETATTLLLWVIGLHVAGALVHQFIWRDGLLKRMM